MSQSNADPSDRTVITRNIRREVILVALERLTGDDTLLGKLAQPPIPPAPSPDRKDETEKLLRQAAKSVGVKILKTESGYNGIDPDVFMNIMGIGRLNKDQLKDLIDARLKFSSPGIIRGGGCK
jgi:hypothetical protein